MNVNTKWIKYRHRWSYGEETEWSYTDVTGIDEAALPDIIEEITQDNKWSTHYRGIEYSYIDIPPLDYLNELIKEMSNKINQSMQYKLSLQRAREKYYGNESSNASINVT